MDEQTILEVYNISKNFIPPLSYCQLIKFNFKHRKPIRALSEVSFKLKKGQILGLLGPNGAGKTTLLKIIAGLILPDKGNVSLNDRFGLVTSQERSFYWRLTGRQNLEFFATLYDLKDGRKKIDELLKFFQIDCQDERFDTYSSGVKQKFSLIRALLNEPYILLLDEPTQNLDFATALNLKNFIKNELIVKKAKAVIFTTHHVAEATAFCDLFMILHKGLLCAFGTLEELRKIACAPNAGLADIYIKLTQ